MKPLLIVSFLFCVGFAHAKNYYISATGSDANNGLTAGTPWQSITKVNAFGFAAGDSVLFKNGDTFYGTIIPKMSGVVFSAYGSGAKPVITGLTTISSWTSLGGNIWEAVVPGGLSTLNVVVINGVLTPMGRWPNKDVANGGYRTYTSFVNNSSITDGTLTSSPNWAGGEVIVRQNDFVIKRLPITSHNSTTINFSGATDLMANYGYFIQNHSSTLDQNGEWYYNAVSKKIKIYYAGTPPAIEVATVSTLLNMVYTASTIKSNITIKGINFRGAEGVMMQLTYCNNLTIDNCDLSYAGINAIDYRYTPYFLFQNSTISDANNIGIREFESSLNHHVTIKNNNIKRVGIFPGMLGSTTFYNESEIACGLAIGSADLLVKENKLDSVGYIAIRVGSNNDNQIIRKNIVTNFCSVKNDGGGIYNSGLRGGPAANNIIIDSNIISKAIGAMEGTPHLYDKHTRAIYLDATSTGVKVLYNTIFDAWDGIYISQAQNNIIKGNTVYNTGNYKPGPAGYFSAALVINDAFDGFQHTRNNTITKNIFFAKNPDQLLYYQIDRYNGVASIGTIDSNYYVNPMNEFPLLLTNTTAASTLAPYSLKMWQGQYPVYDKNSKGTPVKIPQNINTLIGSNKSPNDAFTSNVNGITPSGTNYTFSWDNTSQISGTGSAKLASTVKGSNFTQLNIIVGALDATKKYVLKFKTKASVLGTFKTYMARWGGDYGTITSTKNGVIETGTQQQEILFSGEHTTEGNAVVLLQFSQDNSTVYIDDIEFYEVNTTPTNIDDYVRFEYNPTNSVKTVTLDAKYIGADSTVYNGTITLQPYSSAVLIKSGVITSTLKADAGTDVSLVLPINTTVLKGTATGTVTSYSWTKISGPAQFTIVNPNNPSTAINNLAMGKYTFQLKVTNSAGESAMATVNVVTLGVLPVTLIDFTATKNSEKVALEWKVASEIGVSHYAIERSGNSQAFEKIGEVSAVNLFTIQGKYNYDDNFPLQGINYYRLAMIDKDGTTKYSKIISVTENNVSSFKLNTFSLSAGNNNLKIGINSNYEQVMQVVLADVSGRILYSNPIQLQKGFNAIDKKIPALNTGIYYAKLFTNNQVITKTLLSER